MYISALLPLLYLLLVQFDYICAPDDKNGPQTKPQSSSNHLIKGKFKQAALKVIQQNAENAKEKREQLLKGMTQEERVEYMKEHLIKQLASGNRKRDYISKVLTQRDTKEYVMPKDIEGVVTFKNGRWEVESKVRDETVATILNYVEKRVNTTFTSQVNELKVLKEQNKIKDYEKKVLEDLEKVLDITKMPLPQEGCKVVLNVDERVKNNAYLWELGLMFTQNEVNEEQQKISDLELLYKIGEEKFKNEKDAQAKEEKIKQEHENKKKERQAKVEAKKNELKLNLAKKMDEKKRMPIEAFLDPDEDENKEDYENDDGDDGEDVELSTYAIINSLKYGEKAFSPKAVIDFSKMPIKENEKEEKKFKGLMTFLKEKLKKFYYRLKSHLAKKPEQRKLEEQKDIKKKKIDMVEAKLREEPEDKKKQLLERLGEILRTEDPEIEPENLAADDKKKDDAAEKKVFSAIELDDFPHYEITQQKVKPFDFLKDIRYNIYVKPLKKDFKKLKAKDFYKIVKSMTLCNSGLCDSNVYDQLDPKVLSEYKDKINANDDNIQNCYQVAQLFTKAIYYNPNPTKADPIREQFLGRLGAQTLNSVINARKMVKEIGGALSLSMGAAGGIEVALDMFAWPAVIAAVCGGTLGVGCPAAIPLTMLLYSVTPAITETIDSFVIGKLMDTLKGGHFFPSSKKEFWDALTDASHTGDSAGISAFKSMFKNAIHRHNIVSKKAYPPECSAMSGPIPDKFATFAIRLLSLMPNHRSSRVRVLSTSLENTQKTLSAELYMRLKQEFFPAPPIEELAGLVPEVRKSRKKTAKEWLITFVSYCPQTSRQSVPLDEITKEEKELALFLYAKKDISFSMEVSKTSGLVANSMFIGSIISMVAYIIMGILDHYGVIRVAVSEIVAIIVNQNHVDIFSLGTGTLSATLLGSRWLRGWVTTDAIKNEQIVNLIFEKTMIQMEKQEKKDPNWENTEEITSSELHYIYDTIAHKITKVWGEIINRISLSMTDGLFDGLSIMYNIVLHKDVKSKIIELVEKLIEKFINYKGGFDVFLQEFKKHFKAILNEVKKLMLKLGKFKKHTVSEQELKGMQEHLLKGMGEKPNNEEDEDEEWQNIRNEIGKEHSQR